MKTIDEGIVKKGEEKLTAEDVFTPYNKLNAAGILNILSATVNKEKQQAEFVIEVPEEDEITEENFKTIHLSEDEIICKCPSCGYLFKTTHVIGVSMYYCSKCQPATINKEKKHGEFVVEVEDLTEEEIIPLVEAYFDIITNTSKADRELLKPEVVGKMKIKYWEIAYDCWYHSRIQQEATIKQLQNRIAQQAQEIERLKLNLAREQRFRKEDGMSAAQEQGRQWQEIQTLKAEVERWKQNFLETK